MIDLVRTLVGGFFMGTADLVPGVSGGTIALVLGIYERLVASIKEGSSALGDMVRFRFRDAMEHLKKVEWSLLIPLGIGIGSAVILLASLIDTQLEENPTIMAGVFFGLVIGSIVVAWRILQQPKEWHAFITLGVGIVLFVLLGFGDDGSVSDPGLFAFFVAGSVAICAMILPGISGSLILLILGMYQPVLDAVNERDFTTILVVGAGAILGLALFSQVLKWALDTHHDPVVAALVGLMLGSLRVLWPWPGGVDSPALGAPGDDWVAVSVAGLVGVGLVYVITRVGSARRG